jgi:hypothetical protein
MHLGHKPAVGARRSHLISDCYLPNWLMRAPTADVPDRDEEGRLAPRNEPALARVARVAFGAFFRFSGAVSV